MAVIDIQFPILLFGADSAIRHSDGPRLTESAGEPEFDADYQPILGGRVSTTADTETKVGSRLSAMVY
jgi:hypothetical protein